MQNLSNPKVKDGGSEEEEAPFEVVDPIDPFAEEIFLALFGGMYNAPWDPESGKPPARAAKDAKAWEGTVYRATGLVNDSKLIKGIVLGAAGDIRQSKLRGGKNGARCVGACFKGWLDKAVKEARAKGNGKGAEAAG